MIDTLDLSRVGRIRRVPSLVIQGTTCCQYRLNLDWKLVDLPVLALINVVLVHRIGVVELTCLGWTIRRRMPEIIGTLSAASSRTKRSIKPCRCEHFRPHKSILKDPISSILCAVEYMHLLVCYSPMVHSTRHCR